MLVCKIRDSDLTEYQIWYKLTELQQAFRHFLFFILLASPKKNNQTNKQTERTLAGTLQQLWPITAGPDTKKNKNKKY